MEDQNWDTNSVYGNQLPVNIPSPDAAWNDMRKKLENEKKRRPYWWLIIFLIAGTTLLSIIFITVSTDYFSTENNTTVKKSHSTNQIETNKTNGYQTDDTLFNQLHPADKNITPDIPDHIALSEKITLPNISALDTSSIKNFSRIKSLYFKSKQDDFKVFQSLNTITHKTKKLRAQYFRRNVTIANALTAFDSQQIDSIPENKIIKDTIAAAIATITPRKNKPQVKDILKEDSSVEEEDIDSTMFVAEAGLQWNMQLPFANSSSFFTGPGAQSQPYRILLPGAWISWHSEKSLLSVQVNPFTSLLVPSKSFNTVVANSTSSDTAITKTETKTLKKLFGVSAGLSYDFNVTGNWWFGGNMQANWWRSGIATSNIKTSSQSLSGSFNPINTQSNTIYKLSKPDWENFSTFQMQLNLEILYRKKTWIAGFNAGLPIMPIAKTTGPLNPFYAALFFRVRLWEDKK